MAVAKEQIRQIISENNISSVADVYSLLKESFKDILQELMEAELVAALGYEKKHKGDLTQIAPTILKYMDIAIPKEMKETRTLFNEED